MSRAEKTPAFLWNAREKIFSRTNRDVIARSINSIH